MKTMKFYAAIFAVVIFAISACQKQDSNTSNSKNTGRGTSFARGSIDINSLSVDATFVTWELISVDYPITTFSPGGVAFASAINGKSPSNLKIKFTGSGSFNAPANDGTSDDVSGGGTWETFSGSNSTGTGSYMITKLVSWKFANYSAGPFIDLTGNINERANGTALFIIDYLDGSFGTLGVGCHGPRGPEGIMEGIIATKGFVTYWKGGLPMPNVDENHTIFHVPIQSGLSVRRKN